METWRLTVIFSDRTGEWNMQSVVYISCVLFTVVAEILPTQPLTNTNNIKFILSAKHSKLYFCEAVL